MKLRLINVQKSGIKPIVINTATHVTLHTYLNGDMVFDQSNCKTLESFNWSEVGSYELDTVPCPTSFNPDQWIIDKVF